MPEVGYLITEEKTFLQFKPYSSFTESSKDFTEVMEMIIKGTRSYQNVIKIYETAAPFQAREDCLHQSLKSSGCVTEPEWHPRKLKQAMMSHES